MGLGFLSRAAAFLVLVSAPSSASESRLRRLARPTSTTATATATTTATTTTTITAKATTTVATVALPEVVPYSKDCTSIVGIGVDSNDSKKLNQTWLSCLTKNDMIHDIEGVCTEWVEEKVMRGVIKSNHSSVDIEEATFNRTSDRITLAKFPPPIIPGTFDLPHLKERQKGNRTILAVRIITLDGEPTVTETEIKNSMFAKESYSLKNHMAACSQNKLIFNPKEILPLIAGAVTETVYTPSESTCLTMGEGKETAYASEGDSGNFVTCPNGAFFCYGGGGTYGKEFAMPSELPQVANTWKTLECFVKDDNNRKVVVNVTTHRAQTGFQFEVLGSTDFISMMQLKAGAGGGDSIFKYPYTSGADTFMGAVPKTGIIYTPTNFKGIYRDISNVKMCVIPREKACEHIADEGEIQVNEDTSFAFEQGVITIRVPHFNREGDSIIRNAVTKELISKFGIDKPEDIADYVMYCLPQGVTTAYAYGFIYSWLSVYSDTYCTNLAAQMRNLGHNFGLGPSRNWGHDFGDFTGVMGNNDFTATGRKCFNAPKLYQTGWYTENTVKIYRDTAPNTKIKLHGYIKPIPGTDTKITKIVKLDRHSHTDFYMICNWVTDQIVDTKKDFKNKVMVAQTGFDGEMFDFSFVVSRLGSGDTFTTPLYYDGHCDLTISVGTIDIDEGICDVTVTGCIPDAPTTSPTSAPTAPTVSPTLSPTHPPKPLCLKLTELCEQTSDCCDSNKGECVLVEEKENKNVRIVCSPKGTEPEKAVGPPGPPGGTCNDNDICEQGENCLSCPKDCNGRLDGDTPPAERFCCQNEPVVTVPFGIPFDDTRCSC